MYYWHDAVGYKYWSNFVSCRLVPSLSKVDDGPKYLFLGEQDFKRFDQQVVKGSLRNDVNGELILNQWKFTNSTSEKNKLSIFVMYRALFKN